MQFVAFGQAARPAAKAGVGVFADAADRQRLAIQQRQQAGLSQRPQALLDGVQQGADDQALDAATEGGRGRDTQGTQPGGGPVAFLAGPGDGAIVQGSPEKDGGYDPGL